MSDETSKIGAGKLYRIVDTQMKFPLYLMAQDSSGGNKIPFLANGDIFMVLELLKEEKRGDDLWCLVKTLTTSGDRCLLCFFSKNIEEVKDL